MTTTPTGATDRSSRAAGARDRIWQALQAAVGQPMPSNAALAAAAGDCTACMVAHALEFFRDRGLIEITNDGRRRGVRICGGGELLPAPIARTTDRSRELRAVQAESSISPRGLTRDGRCGHEIRDARGRLLWRQGDDPETWTRRLWEADVSYAPPGGDPRPVEPPGGGMSGRAWRQARRAAGTPHPDYRVANRQDRRITR